MGRVAWRKKHGLLGGWGGRHERERGVGSSAGTMMPLRHHVSIGPQLLPSATHHPPPTQPPPPRRRRIKEYNRVGEEGRMHKHATYTDTIHTCAAAPNAAALRVRVSLGLLSALPPLPLTACRGGPPDQTTAAGRSCLHSPRWAPDPHPGTGWRPSPSRRPPRQRWPQTPPRP